MQISVVPLEAVSWKCSVKKMFLKISQNSQEITCARVSYKKILALVFSCEFYEIFKSTFFIEHLRWLLLSI